MQAKFRLTPFVINAIVAWFVITKFRNFKSRGDAVKLAKRKKIKLNKIFILIPP